MVDNCTVEHQAMVARLGVVRGHRPKVLIEASNRPPT